jgi:hypothetical protein
MRYDPPCAPAGVRRILKGTESHIMVVGDLHLRLPGSEDDRHVLSWLRSELQMRRPAAIVLAGDTFELAGSHLLSTSATQRLALQNAFDRLSTCLRSILIDAGVRRLVLLTGDHDRSLVEHRALLEVGCERLRIDVADAFVHGPSSSIVLHGHQLDANSHACRGAAPICDALETALDAITTDGSDAAQRFASACSEGSFSRLYASGRRADYVTAMERAFGFSPGLYWRAVVQATRENTSVEVGSSVQPSIEALVGSIGSSIARLGAVRLLRMSSRMVERLAWRRFRNRAWSMLASGALTRSLGVRNAIVAHAHRPLRESRMLRGDTLTVACVCAPRTHVRGVAAGRVELETHEAIADLTEHGLMYSSTSRRRTTPMRAEWRGEGLIPIETATDWVTDQQLSTPDAKDRMGHRRHRGDSASEVLA